VNDNPLSVGDMLVLGMPGADGLGPSSAEVKEVTNDEIVLDSDGRFASAKPGVVLTVRRAAEYGRIGWVHLLQTTSSNGSIYMKTTPPRWEKVGSERGARHPAEYRVIASLIEHTPEGPRQRHFSGHTLDFSSKGARVWLMKEFEPNEFLQIKVYFCPDTPMVAVARAVHVRADREGFKVGLEFVKVIEGADSLAHAIASEERSAA
jgi:hypothetical protein